MPVRVHAPMGEPNQKRWGVQFVNGTGYIETDDPAEGRRLADRFARAGYHTAEAESVPQQHREAVAYREHVGAEFRKVQGAGRAPAPTPDQAGRQEPAGPTLGDAIAAAMTNGRK